MKVVIAGTRTVNDYDTVKAAVESSPFKVTEVISGHGGCSCPLNDGADCTVTGVDALGERWGAEQGLIVRRYPADWERFGKSADYGDAETEATRRRSSAAERAPVWGRVEGSSPCQRHSPFAAWGS